MSICTYTNLLPETVRKAVLDCIEHNCLLDNMLVNISTVTVTESGVVEFKILAEDDITEDDFNDKLTMKVNSLIDIAYAVMSDYTDSRITQNISANCFLHRTDEIEVFNRDDINKIYDCTNIDTLIDTIRNVKIVKQCFC